MKKALLYLPHIYKSSCLRQEGQLKVLFFWTGEGNEERIVLWLILIAWDGAFSRNAENMLVEEG